jgi:hypothetical protein
MKKIVWIIVLLISSICSLNAWNYRSISVFSIDNIGFAVEETFLWRLATYSVLGQAGLEFRNNTPFRTSAGIGVSIPISDVLYISGQYSGIWYFNDALYSNRLVLGVQYDAEQLSLGYTQRYELNSGSIAMLNTISAKYAFDRLIAVYLSYSLGYEINNPLSHGVWGYLELMTGQLVFRLGAIGSTTAQPSFLVYSSYNITELLKISAQALFEFSEAGIDKAGLNCMFDIAW